MPISWMSAGGITLSAFIVLRWFLSSRKQQSLREKVVLITGASSGLGEACAHVFYRAGCKLILCARRTDQLERVKKELGQIKQSSPTYEPKVLPLDVSDTTKISDKIQSAIELYGFIDIVVNNAGISYRGEIAQTTLDVDKQVMNVNYFGQVAVTKAVLPHMIQRKTGHIVFVSSIQGKLGLPYRSAYGASKHAIQSFSDSLRAEMSHLGIKVTVVSPAYIKTNLSMNALTDNGSNYGVMDETQKSGMDVTSAARIILDAVVYQKNEILAASLFYRIVVYLRNIFPDSYSYVMSLRARKSYLIKTK